METVHTSRAWMNIPENVSRNIFHMFNATWGVLAYHYLVPRWLALVLIGGIALVLVGGEIARLSRPLFNDRLLQNPLVGRIIRPHERDRISGAAYFVVGVWLVLLLFPIQAVEAGCLAMGFGDASATLVGRRYGRTALVGRKTLEGTLTFVMVTFGVVLLFRSLLYGSAGWPANLLVSGTAAVVGALVELLSGRVDDNLTTPVLTAGAVTLVLVFLPL